jgi:hypothetical protein
VDAGVLDMSMDRCKCGKLVDTDEFPESYLMTIESLAKPFHEQKFECHCPACWENVYQNTEEEIWRQIAA